jgi:site-specific recombinase XerD
MKGVSLCLSQVIEGYLLEAHARRLSPGTISDYSNAFRKLQRYLADDPPFAAIGIEQVRGFLADLAQMTEPKPLSKKALLNIHTGLSALWTWAVREGIVERHLLRDVPRPRAETRAVEPFSQEDVKALLAVCERSAAYRRPGKVLCDNERPTGVRDRAMILLLLDTGIRASELCGLQLRQVDLKNRHIVVMGKGSKERQLPISAQTSKALWKYLVSERKDARLNEEVFEGHYGGPLTRDALLKVLRRLGERAGVEGCHPHRFRHTFAIQYLRNGGNTLALQASLGHTTLEMVRVYAQIAQADLDNGHLVASPVANWRL